MIGRAEAGLQLLSASISLCAFCSAVAVSFCPVTLCRKASHRISYSLLVSRYAPTNDAASADDSIASVINHAQICLRFIFILLFYYPYYLYCII